MKKFVITILLFFIPLIVFLGVLEFGMRIVPNDYAYKNQWLDNNISTLQIWSFGPSNGLVGISPKHFSKKAFNSAHVSQPLKYDAFIFDKFIDRADSMEWVIVPMCYWTLVGSMEDGEEWWRAKNYCIYYDCPYFHFQPKFHFEVIGNPLSIYKQIKRVVDYIIHGTDDITCDTFGLALNFAKDSRRENWYMNGANRVKDHTKDLSKTQLIEANRGYLQSIIDKCEKKHVRVLLLTTPVCYTYSDAVDSVQYTMMTSTCEEMAAQYPHVEYLNMFTDTRFDVEDFWDADHLNTDGAVKLTRMLNEYIENYIVEP